MNNLLYHILAIVIVGIWGVTFINSKVLLLHGLTPHEIFQLRFIIAYVCIWFISPRKLFADGWRDELLMMVLGITGGSIYFLAENTAVGITYVNNVSFILCSNPLITTFISILVLRNLRATPRLMWGSMVALVGVALVIYNGSFILHLNPLGDFLALAAAFSWSIYSLLIKRVTGRYSIIFITRKLFFYGLLTMIPVFMVSPWKFPLEGFRDPAVWMNLAFLGFIASFGCFYLWNVALQKIGTIAASNYIYLNPITTMIASALFLDEPVTSIAFLGSFLILAGVFWANKGIEYKNIKTD
ncbi:MAG: DMT family transporter [Bacteroidaceae bacterium]|nr:DMT family transporter [Bacteroidaceae bacterium]